MSNTLADYNLWLVSLSYVVSVFGALAGLLTATRIPRQGGIHYGWLGLSAILFGGGAVWSMHFLGMVAFQPGIAITYDIRLTVVSMILPVALFALGLFAVYRWSASLPVLAVSGTIMGLGVASMHYTGMAAMRIEAEMTHGIGWVALSVLIGIVASVAALLIVVRFHGLLRYAASLVMGLAVCGLHYTAMAGMELTALGHEVDHFTGAVTTQQMAFMVAVVVTVLYMTSLGLVWFLEDYERNRRLQRIRSGR